MWSMNRRFLVVSMCLTATIAFLVGMIVAGSLMPARAISAPEPSVATTRRTSAATADPAGISFADVAERLNPAVVNIDATVRSSGRTRRRLGAQEPGPQDP